MQRRNFIKAASLSTLASAVPIAAFAEPERIFSRAHSPLIPDFENDMQRVYFINDGIFYRPGDYLDKLQQIHKSNPITRDFYGDDGTLKELLAKCCEITGKQAAVYMPSGTLANQLALQVLSGGSPKVVVQESSHVHRDEADAAQTIYSKRLIPLGKEKADFTLDELKAAIAYQKNEEVFAAPIGALSVETPIRRFQNAYFPLGEIQKITAFCKEQGIKTHLDGARLHIAAAHTGHTVLDYARHFDSVYLCLYKYLGAQGGAVLCGDQSLIDQMPHLIKVHGGGIFTNWGNAAMALHHLNDIDSVLQSVIKKAASLFAEINKIPGLKVTDLHYGTNIHQLFWGKGIDTVKAAKWLRDEKGIIIAQPHANGASGITVNPTLLRRSNDELINAFVQAIKV